MVDERAGEGFPFAVKVLTVPIATSSSSRQRPFSGGTPLNWSMRAKSRSSNCWDAVGGGVGRCPAGRVRRTVHLMRLMGTVQLLRIGAVAGAVLWAAWAADAGAQDDGASDRKALEALYDATGGATWTHNTNWKTAAPLGQWGGVTTAAGGRVTGLDLSENALSGSLPPELGSLSSLAELNLGGNALTGPVPAWLAGLSDLEVLSLWDNELSGRIPAALGSLARLRWLSLSRNELSGPIPPELGQLTRLERLYLYRNDLSGPVPPELGDLVRLERLSLHQNDFRGSIPGELGRLMNLEQLYLDYNWGLSGPLPARLRSQTLERLGVFATRTCAPAAWRDWLETITFSGRLCETGTDVTIDVAVVYTPAARLASGGAAAIEAEIDLAVSETNQAYRTSGVHHRIALVERWEVAYVETGDSAVDLRRLWNPSDGHLDEVHALRDGVGADLVHLIVDNDDLIGRAYVHNAFGLSTQGAGGRVFAHELGHNMGLRHDRYRDRDDEIRLFPHPAYGYVNQRAFVPGGSRDRRWRTIMSDPAQCAYLGLTCRWLLRFSNARQVHHIDPLGVAYGAGESKVTGPADASAVLNVTGPAVALWRKRPSDDANRPPALVRTLPDRTLPAPPGMLAVDVSAAFADPDGDALAYAASSAALDVATVQVAGTGVTLAAVGAGTSTIAVTATDPGGLSASGTFSVTVPAPGAFTDHPIRPGLTRVRAIHFAELRVRIDALREAGGLGPSAWTDPVLTALETPVRLRHLLELREALAEAYAAAGRAAPDWTDAAPEAGTTPIRAVHLTELRAAVIALER